MPKILVTGSGGNLGYPIFADLRMSGYNVIGTTADICKMQKIAPYFEGIDYVIHTAAKTRRCGDKSEYHRVNVLGTKNILDLCVENNCKLIHFSSIARNLFYGRSKQESQQMVIDYCDKRGLKAIILRLCPIIPKDSGIDIKGRYYLEDLIEDIKNIINTHNFNKCKVIEYPKFVKETKIKNIFFYLSPEKKFDKVHNLMSGIQIKNSLDYWDKKDIIVVTNFPWECEGIKAIVAGDEVYCSVLSHGLSMSNKPNVIKFLIENKLVDDINWIHDWDAFQIAPLDLPPIKKDIGFINYGYKPRIQFGNVYFKPNSYDVWQWISDAIYEYNTDEEETTNILIDKNFNNIRSRYQMLNITYNVSRWCLNKCPQDIEMPMRVIHFPPHNMKYLHKFSKIMPPKLKDMLYEKFDNIH